MDAWEIHALGGILGEAHLMVLAVVMVSTYSFFVLGGMSAVHFRSITAFIGIGCVFLSMAVGYALALFAGFQGTNFHSIIPYMILGIGVDDMFVIVNSIDQAPQHLSAEQRFKIGFSHAGPSITITSVTGALAFFLGAITPLLAIKSFCIFAAFCVCSLYVCFISIFSAWFVIDLRRMHTLKGDCCGLCCCKLESVFCCKGFFLTTK